MTMQFGRLEALNPHEYWPNEAVDFTPWLAAPENVSLLGDALGLQLEVEATEQSVGPFSADIVGRVLGDDHRVVIENQLERTDHDHLGKLLTYAAGLDDVRTVIWIAGRFTEEHRAALDWLNSVTDEGTRFFGVEIQVLRIGDSLPAPRFELVAKPNEWSKTVRAAAESQGLSAHRQLRLEFWTDFHRFLDEGGASIRIGKAVPETWVTASMGRGGVSLSAVVSTYDLETLQTVGDGINRVELVLDNRLAGSYFQQLLAQGSEVEAQLGPVVWYAPEGARGRKIFVQQTAPSLEVRTAWDQQFEWLRQRMEDFDRVFRPLVRDLATAEADDLAGGDQTALTPP